MIHKVNAADSQHAEMVSEYRRNSTQYGQFYSLVLDIVWGEQLLLADVQPINSRFDE